MTNAQQIAALEKSPSPVGRAAASGVAWMLTLTIGGRFATLLSQLVLAKLLMPKDFGVVGLAYTIIIFFSALTSFGIEDVFQQRYSRMRFWATQTFVLTLLLSLVAMLLMIAYAPIGARVYHDRQVELLVWILSVTLPLNALATVPQARLRSLLRFRFLAIYNSADLIVSQCLTILLAWYGAGAMSFVIPLPLLAAVRAVIMWRVAPMPLRPLRLARGWTQMITRSLSAFGIRVLNAGISQGDYFTLGLVSTSSVVGVYVFAFKLVAQPMILLAGNFNGVVRPALVTLNDDPRRQCDIAFRLAELLGLLTVPIGFMQAAIAAPGLALLFGSRWSDAVPLIQILSVGLPLDAVSWAAGSLLESRGQFSTSLRYQAISAPFFFLFVGVGALTASSAGVAVGVSTYYILHPIYLTSVVFCREGVSLRRVLGCFYLPVLLASGTIGGAYALTQAPMFRGEEAWQIAFVITFGGAAYLMATRRWSPKVYQEISYRLDHIVRRRRP